MEESQEETTRLEGGKRKETQFRGGAQEKRPTVLTPQQKPWRSGEGLEGSYLIRKKRY